jgi:ribosomal-protein-alanine N-acetyltransferase
MNSTGSVRRIEASDPALEKIKVLDKYQFPQPWSEESWKTMNWDFHHLFAFELAGEIIGFCLFFHTFGDDASHLLKICINIENRGSGHSSVLWSKVQDHLRLTGIKSIFLEVEARNERAIGFYFKNHFKKLRTVKHFYSNGEDALTMILML